MVMTTWTMDTDRISKQEQKQFGTWWCHSDGEYSLGNDYDDKDDKEPQLMIKLLAAKQRRKEMWSAIDVNDNGYASLSEITRVSGSFLWYENYTFLWCSNQMTKGSNVWYGKLVSIRVFEMWSTPTTSLTRVQPSIGLSITVENWPRFRTIVIVSSSWLPFQHLFSNMQSDREHGDDFLEFKEFRIFLRTLRQFFEYHQAFKRFGNFKKR